MRGRTLPGLSVIVLNRPRASEDVELELEPALDASCSCSSTAASVVAISRLKPGIKPSGMPILKLCTVSPALIPSDAKI